MIEYSFETPIRIDWSDLDSLGHVNNLAIMRYMQTATIAYFENIGILPNDKTLEASPIMASVNGQFKKQLYYPGNVKVLTSATEMKTTSIHLKHYVIDDNNEVVAEGHNVLVVFNFKKNAKQAIPLGLRNNIELVESKRKQLG